MYKVVNRSTTQISIDGANLAPGKSKSIDKISGSLRYLESKRLISIEFLNTPIQSKEKTPERKSWLEPKEFKSKRTKEKD